MDDTEDAPSAVDQDAPPPPQTDANPVDPPEHAETNGGDPAGDYGSGVQTPAGQAALDAGTVVDAQNDTVAGAALNEGVALGSVGDPDPAALPESRGPQSWPELKGWVRRELELFAQGHNPDVRDTMNP